MSDEKKPSIPYATVQEVMMMMNARAEIKPDKANNITVKRDGKDVAVRLSAKVLLDAKNLADAFLRSANPKAADEVKAKYASVNVTSKQVGRSKSNPFGSESFSRAVYENGSVVVPSIASVFGPDVKKVYVTKQGAGANALIIIGSTEASVKGFNLPKK